MTYAKKPQLSKSLKDFFFHAVRICITAQGAQRKVVHQGLVSTELQFKNSPVALHFNLVILSIQQGKTGVVGPSQTCLAFAFLTLTNATLQTIQHKVHETFRVPMAGSYNVNFDWQRTIQDEDLKTAQAATTDTGSSNESIFKQWSYKATRQTSSVQSIV